MIKIIWAILIAGVIFYQKFADILIGKKLVVKCVYSGMESSGKSLALSRKAKEIALRNFEWFKITGHARKIASKMHFSKEFENWYEKNIGEKIIYWQNCEELPDLGEGIDIFWDEIHVDLDSRNWSNLSSKFRNWYEQGGKQSIEIYATCQDFSQVDVSFRRLTRKLFYLVKVCGSERPHKTIPSSKYIWGLVIGLEMDPQKFDKEKNNFEIDWWRPAYFFIKREDCERFDTHERIKK